MELLIAAIIQWMQQNPNADALATVVGLGGFMKLVGVPAIKVFANYINKPIVGKNTTFIAVGLSIVVAEIVGLSTKGLTFAVFMQMASIGFISGWTALGIQETSSAIIRPNKFN